MGTYMYVDFRDLDIQLYNRYNEHVRKIVRR